MGLHGLLQGKLFLFFYTTFPPRISKEEKDGGTRVCTIRTVCSGVHLLLDEKFLEVSDQYKNLARISPSDFEFLINLIGPKCEVFHVQSSCSSRRRTGSYIAGDTYTSLNFETLSRPDYSRSLSSAELTWSRQRAVFNCERAQKHAQGSISRSPNFICS
jgi:hypothetical protein